MTTQHKTIYTIGHSNHPIDFFLELLQSQKITCIVDVRSTPASKFNPQFNQRPLANFLKEHGVVYLHFGHEFGARQDDEKLLDENGCVNFKWFRKTRAFQDGVERIDIGLEKGFNIALMCSESNPLECHRFSMVSVHLEEIGIRVKHILKDKTVLSNGELEEQMLKKFKKKLPQPSLFEPYIDKKAQLEAAYELHNQWIGWKPKDQNQIDDAYD
ncbi:MAG: DUF488 domain-containing protein [Bacteroidota bacterium]